MYLAELELQGFKSFATKTKIRFDSGITAIVGPNGCGKSNIVDALRWVLGEQRPSLLRSAAMTHVIFNGSSSKKALGMAEVSVTISNNKGILPTEYSDITMTRRLYRSGDSEYFLNKKKCRLKDIIDLFMDTGMGANAYSVIELKMVEEILNDKSNDRRKLFEEAAGITKFKERKKQTLKRLSDTRADLQRMEDILTEIEKKARSLQAQASRAERSQKYQKELEFLDKAVSHREYLEVKNQLDPLLERIAQASAAREELQLRLNQMEEGVQLSHQDLIRLEQVQNDARKKGVLIRTNVQEKQTEIRIFSEKIAAEELVIQRYEQDIVQAENDIKNLRSNQKKNEAELREALAEQEKMLHEKQASEKIVLDNQNLVQAIRRKRDQAAARHNEINQRIGTVQNRKIRQESRIENALEQEQRLILEAATAQERIKQIKMERTEAKKSLHQAETVREEEEKLLSDSLLLQETLLDKIEIQKDSIRNQKSKYKALQSEHDLLKSLSESSDSYSTGVQYLMDHRASFRKLEILSDVFSTDDRYSAAVEAVLGDALHFVIVSDVEEIEMAFHLLKKEDKGRVTLVPLDIITAPVQPLENGLSYRINCRPEYEPLKDLLFGQVLLANNLKQARNLAAEKKAAVVTPQGDLVTLEGFHYSGSESKRAGVRIGLKDKIATLSAQALKMAPEIEAESEELKRLEQELGNCKVSFFTEKVKQASSFLQKAQSRLNTLEIRKDFFQTNLQELENKIGELKQSATEARDELETLSPELQDCKSELDTIIREEIALRSELQEKEELLQRVQTQYNQAALASQNADNAVLSLEKEVNRFDSDQLAIRNRLSQRASQATESKDKILTLRQELQQAEEELKDLLADAEDQEKELARIETECSRQRGKIHLLEDDLKKLRRNKESNQELIHSLEMARSKLEMDQKTINDHLWESYQITLDQVKDELPEDTDIATARETIFTLKQRLKNIGEVNPLAIREYQEEKSRLDHFHEQIEDLEKAEEQLHQTIHEINRNAEERFNSTFQQIRQNFRLVFTTLFGEDDHCDLVIDQDAEDPLEAKIEIIANPRGKRPSIVEQLSGGEKTLTAIALLFAIYLVKPSPFCVMDEVDAPLDDPNILRFTRLLKKFSNETQFIVITHNKTTMEKSEMMYGVTMQEAGISKLVGVRLDDIAV